MEGVNLEDLMQAVNAYTKKHGDAALAAALGYRTSTVVTRWRVRGNVPKEKEAQIRAIVMKEPNDADV